MNEGTVINNTTEPASTHPEDNGDKGRMFTQEDVNRIVSERLTRERTKAEPVPDEREQELSAREARLDCREYITEQGLPVELLDILGGCNLEQFKTTVEKLRSIGFGYAPERYTATAMSHQYGHEGTNDDPVSAAFKPKR